MTQWTRFLAFGCTHFPVHRPSALDWLVQQIQEYQPTFLVHLGDVLDFDPEEVGGHGNYHHDMLHEYDVGNEAMTRVRDAAPGAECWITEGNHGARQRRNHRTPERMQRVVSMQRNMRSLKDWGWKPHTNERKACVRLGQVSFSHGFGTGTNSDRDEGIRLGKPWGLHVRAHTHRPVPVTRARLNTTTSLPYWYANVGTTTGPLKPSYVEDKDTIRWGGGIVIGEAARARSARDTPNWRAKLVMHEWGCEESNPVVDMEVA